jgi:hypothetical protein
MNIYGCILELWVSRAGIQIQSRLENSSWNCWFNQLVIADKHMLIYILTVYAAQLL